MSAALETAIKQCEADYGCGQWKPAAEFWKGDIACKDCRKRRKAAIEAGEVRKKRNRVRSVEYVSETPRDRAIVPARTEAITLHGRNFTVGWHEGATYWPVKPFVEAAGLTWQGQHQRIDGDSRLVQGIRKILIPTPGGDQEMLCLPWASWHYFWSGTHSPKAERWRQEAYEALRLVFGETAGEVLQEKPFAERIIQKFESKQAPSFADLARSNPQLVVRIGKMIEAAEYKKRERERIKQETACALERAKQLKAEADSEEKRARAADASAEKALQDAEDELNAILREADETTAGETEYVYLFGEDSIEMQIFADGKVGDTKNRAQRLKALKAGRIKGNFRAIRPCEDGPACAAAVLSYLCRNGATRIGNDHFENAPGSAIRFVLGVLNTLDFITVEALELNGIA